MPRIFILAWPTLPITWASCCHGHVNWEMPQWVICIFQPGIFPQCTAHAWVGAWDDAWEELATQCCAFWCVMLRPINLSLFFECHCGWCCYDEMDHAPHWKWWQMFHRFLNDESWWGCSCSWAFVSAIRCLNELVHLRVGVVSGACFYRGNVYLTLSKQ